MPTHGDITPRGRATSGKARAGLSLYALALCAIAACDTSCKSELIVSYEQADGSDHPPPLPAAPSPASDITREQALEVYQRFRDACVRKDTQAVWDLLDDSSRQKTAEAAARLRELGSEDLRSVFGYQGPLDGFDAFELHRADLERPLNLCTDAQRWTAEATGPRGSDYAIVIGRGKGSTMDIVVHRIDVGAFRVRTASWFTPP